MNGLGNQNKWKYSTIALLAVVAVGLSFPQASAAASATLNDVYKKLTTVETNVNAIKAKTDSIPNSFTDTFTTSETSSGVRHLSQTDGHLIEINISAQCSFDRDIEDDHENTVRVTVFALGANGGSQHFQMTKTLADGAVSFSTGPVVAYGPTDRGFTYIVDCFAGPTNEFDHMNVMAWGHILS